MISLFSSLSAPGRSGWGGITIHPAVSTHQATCLETHTWPASTSTPHAAGRHPYLEILSHGAWYDGEVEE